MKTKLFSSSFKMALWICLGSLVVLGLVFPEIMVHRAASFLVWDDYLIDYQSSFALTGFFYQGGLQLWDFFGQLPHAFFWVTHGMFRIPSVLTAIVYVLLSPFSDNSAQFFDRVFSIVYMGSFLCIRAVGIFLLLKRFTEDKRILLIGPVVFSLFFCPSVFLLGTFYQNFYPLLMYFILSFFLDLRPVYLGLALLFLMISFSQGLIHTFCLYLGINFFVIACGLYSLWGKGSVPRWQQFFQKNARLLIKGGLWILAASVVILGPYLYMLLFCLKDVAFAVDHSRLMGMWNIARYFQGWPPLDQTPPADYFRRMLDFTFLPGRSFFLGYSIFFLSGLALAMSRDRRKWIFVLTIALLWFINFPRNAFSIGLIGHALNVLTNPFKVMVTSYQMATNAILWYLLMPLAVMGIGVLKDVTQGTALGRKRWGCFGVFMLVYALNGCAYQPGIVKIYFIVAMITSLTALGLLVFVPKHRLRRRIAIAVFIILVLVDMALSARQMKGFLASYCALRPHTVEALASQTGPAGLDFHNPKIFPFVNQTDIYPIVEQSYLWTLRDMSLNFNSVINRETALVPIENHSPRHMAFKGWVNDPSMREYLSQNNRLFFFTSVGVEQSPGIFDGIVQHHLSKEVMMVQGPQPSLKSSIPSALPHAAAVQDQWFSLVQDINDSSPGWVYRDGMAIWDFPIQGSLPNYFASNIFTRDHWVRFFIQTADQKYVELEPVQGQLLRPMTFDAQNIKEGKVFVALPANTSLAGLKGILLFKVKDGAGITSVWLHHSDDTGITFQAPSDGWLGIAFPYDPKWSIEIDGKQVPFYRANKSFIGLPITQGEHRVLIRYWPNSWLRWGIPLSVILASLLFIIIIIYALHE